MAILLKIIGVILIILPLVYIHADDLKIALLTLLFYFVIAFVFCREEKFFQ